jgi:excisionase family DNA binding protein
MKNETKMQVMDFIRFLETSGKLNLQEHKRLCEALEPETIQKVRAKTMPTVLTRQEVARMLKVSTRTIDRMCEDGKLKYWKLGPRYIRFNLEDVLAVINRPELNLQKWQ